MPRSLSIACCSALRLAVVVGLPLGVLMARFKRGREFLPAARQRADADPLLRLVPVFILWFGIGNLTAILIVFYAATFPMLLNTWSGVRSVNPLWLRAAGAMGADEHRLFWKVIIPGASPFIITGMRQAFLRAWIAVIGAEMLAASDWGLGWVIFDAKEFLNADMMLASLVVIGVIGFAIRALGFRLDRTRDGACAGAWCARPKARRDKASSMVPIEIRDVSLNYDTPGGKVPGVKDVNFDYRRLRIPLHRRSFRLRQVDPAQHHRRVSFAGGGRNPHRRQEG